MAFFVAGAAGCGDGSSEDSQGAAEVDGDGYELRLPEGWSESPDAPTEGAAATSDEILGPDRSGYRTDTFLERKIEGEVVARGGVSIEGVPEGISFDQFAQLSLSNAERVGLTQVGSTEETSLDGERAFRAELRQTADGLTIRSTSVTVLHEDEATTLTMAAREDRFEQTLSDFDSMLDSFRLTQ